MKKFCLFAALVIVLASATLVAAGPPGRGEWGNPGWATANNILSKLNLTAEQTEKIRVLRESFQKNIIPLRTQIFEKKAEMRLLWMQTETDAKTIRAKQKQIHDLKWQVLGKTTDFRLAVRSVLTPEQLSKFLALGGDWKRHQGRDRRDHRGPGKGLKQGRQM